MQVVGKKVSRGDFLKISGAGLAGRLCSAPLAAEVVEEAREEVEMVAAMPSRLALLRSPPSSTRTSPAATRRSPVTLPTACYSS